MWPDRGDYVNASLAILRTILSVNSNSWSDSTVFRGTKCDSCAGRGHQYDLSEGCVTHADTDDSMGATGHRRLDHRLVGGNPIAVHALFNGSPSAPLDQEFPD